MTYLHKLNNSLSALQNQKSSVEGQLRKYSQRKIEIEHIVKNLINISDNNYIEMSNGEDQIINNLGYCLNGTSSVSSIVNSVSDKKEKGSYSDGKISSAIDDLKRELTSIESNINSLSSEMTSVKNRINSTKVSIRNEEKRIKEEKLKKSL